MDALRQGSTPQGSAPRSHSPQYAPSGQQQPAQKPAEAEVVVAPCGSWSEFFRCPLIIFSILAFIFFIADGWSIFRASQQNVVGTSFWVTSLLSLLIYLILVFVFGYWIKKKCEECKTGQSWLIFLLAIFFPIILGFVVNVLIGAFAGGIAYLSQSFGGGGKSGKKMPPAPQPAPPAPAPGNPPVVQPPVQANAAPASNNPVAALSQALNQLAGGQA